MLSKDVYIIKIICAGGGLGGGHSGKRTSEIVALQ